MQRIALNANDFNQGLVPTYTNIARKSGYPVTQNTVYDCRKLDIANNIQEAWISFYHDLAITKDPLMSEMDIHQSIMMLLLNLGAKVNHSLHDNEVAIMPGFASEES